jgi:hypothetical protein
MDGKIRAEFSVKPGEIDKLELMKTKMIDTAKKILAEKR